jgi:ribosomal subunit interface protein
MQIPLQCTFRGMTHSAALAAHVRRRAQKLDRFFHHIIHCHVVLEVNDKHYRHGRRYRVSIDLTVPRHEIAIARRRAYSEVLDDAHVAVDRAFDDAERCLDEWEQRRRTHVKADARHHAPLARVSRVFGDRGFGFLETEDGEEVYFHKNSVLRAAFEALSPGVLVRYYEEIGDDGPQASTVEIVA